MRRYPSVATIHAFVTVGCGLLWASSGKPTVRLACLGSYIVGAEILWRMTHAVIFWEIGKYALIGIFFVGSRNAPMVKKTNFPLAYVALLIPATFLTIASLDVAEMRRQVSFNLSGPLALAFSANYFARMRLDRPALTKILLAYLIPVCAIWTLVVSRIVSTDQIVFTSESNSNLSGGFGPNQVSSVLGFGALIVLMVGLFGLAAKQRLYRAICLVLAVVLGAQSALTFSRSGLYLAVASTVLACALAVRDRRRRITLAASGVAVYFIVSMFVVPMLDRYTDGTLSRRFSDAQTTGRADLMKADLLVWRDNLLLGVGPGRANTARTEYLPVHTLASHSEITRMLSEHGLLGLAALCWLCWSAARNVMNISRLEIRAIVAATVTFGMLYLFSNAMRIVLCSFLLGLCFADFRNFAPTTSARSTLRRHHTKRPIQNRLIGQRHQLRSSQVQHALEKHAPDAKR